MLCIFKHTIHFVNFVYVQLSDSDYVSNSMYVIYSVTVNLTVRGFANWPTVIDYIYQYIALLRQRKPEKRIFDELQAMAKISYG